MHHHPSRLAAWFTLGGWILLAGCAGNMPTTNFLNPKFDFSFVERTAVLPFENLSSDRQAGFRATRLLITELLATGAVDVVEPGEVRAAIATLPSAQQGRFTVPSTEELIMLGEALGVQAVILGSVAQSETLRSGPVAVPVVTLDVHMVETESGTTVWAATHTEKGGTVAARLVGAGGKPISATTRRCVQRLVQELTK